MDKESQKSQQKIFVRLKTAFAKCLSNPEFWVELPLQSGELQYLNNQEIAHYRSEFEDYDDPLQKRLLIRSWHREHGEVRYNGQTSSIQIDSTLLNKAID